MTPDTPAYGLWSLVVINAAVFLIFAFSFTRPRTTRDWRSFGAFSAFMLALFTERGRKPREAERGKSLRGVSLAAAVEF